MKFAYFVKNGFGIGDTVNVIKALIEEVQELQRDVQTLKAIYTAVQLVLADRQAADRARESS